MTDVKTRARGYLGERFDMTDRSDRQVLEAVAEKRLGGSAAARSDAYLRAILDQVAPVMRQDSGVKRVWRQDAAGDAGGDIRAHAKVQSQVIADLNKHRLENAWRTPAAKPETAMQAAFNRFQAQRPAQEPPAPISVPGESPRDAWIRRITNSWKGNS